MDWIVGMYNTSLTNRGTAHQHLPVLVGHTRSQIFTRSQ
ncbi:hypothetical protein ACN38_g12724, partial [Penicillium nordicum]